MRLFSKTDVNAGLDFESLIDALHEAFASKLLVQAPERQHYRISNGTPPASESALLLMPAWDSQTGEQVFEKSFNKLVMPAVSLYKAMTSC